MVSEKQFAEYFNLSDKEKEAIKNKQLRVNKVDLKSLPFCQKIIEFCDLNNLTYETYRQKIGPNIQAFIDFVENKKISGRYLTVVKSLKNPNQICVTNIFDDLKWFYFNEVDRCLYHNIYNKGEILKYLHAKAL